MTALLKQPGCLTSSSILSRQRSSSGENCCLVSDCLCVLVPVFESGMFVFYIVHEFDRMTFLHCMFVLCLHVTASLYIGGGFSASLGETCVIRCRPVCAETCVLRCRPVCAETCVLRRRPVCAETCVLRCRPVCAETCVLRCRPVCAETCVLKCRPVCAETCVLRCRPVCAETCVLRCRPACAETCANISG